MKIAFVHFPGRLSRLDGARAGSAPREFLFGGAELAEAGHEVEHYEIDPQAPASRIPRRLIDGNAGRGHLPPHLSASVLSGTHRLLPQLAQADVVIGTTTATAMALAVWRRSSRLRRPVVGIVAGLLNRPWRSTRRLTTLPLLRQMHSVLYGVGELDGFCRLDHRLDARVHVVPFGVDAAFWAPSALTMTDTVFAIGNDGHRDWATLLGAARNLPERVLIVTSHPVPDELPANVTWRPSDWYRQLFSDAEIRDLFREAAVVVVPVKDVPQPSGQSVTLQAMACGRPVVLSRTRGLWEPEALKDGENIVLVEPGDPDELTRCVRGLLDDPGRAVAIGRAARASVLRDSSVETYAGRLLDVCRAALEHP
jgi:glycosyltransferase involved in cell wall biosynthesis